MHLLLKGGLPDDDGLLIVFWMPAEKLAKKW